MVGTPMNTLMSPDWARGGRGEAGRGGKMAALGFRVVRYERAGRRQSGS